MQLYWIAMRSFTIFSRPLKNSRNRCICDTQLSFCSIHWMISLNKCDDEAVGLPIALHSFYHRSYRNANLSKYAEFQWNLLLTIFKCVSHIKKYFNRFEYAIRAHNILTYFCHRAVLSGYYYYTYDASMN